MEPKWFLDTEAAAEYYGVSVRTLQRWRLEGRGPDFVKLGRLVRYTREDLDQHAAAQRREMSTAVA